MKLLYKPIGIVAGLLAGLLSRRIFDVIWAKIDEEEAPKPTHQDVPVAKIVTAAALQGIVFKATKATVNHYGARGFYHVTGTWPGKKPAPKE